MNWNSIAEKQKHSDMSFITWTFTIAAYKLRKLRSR